MNREDKLQSSLQQLHSPVPPHTFELLLAHLKLLKKWNHAYNLTAITQLESMWVKHVLDSLVVLPFLKGEHFLDIGSGAGFPGIPLAIANPKCQWTLLDSSAKKICFLTQVIAELSLTNVQIAHSRVENYRPKIRFDAMISRAVGTIKDTLENSQHLLLSQGHYYAMKGQHPKSEIACLDHPAIVHALNVPNLNQARHLVIVAQSYLMSNKENPN